MTAILRERLTREAKAPEEGSAVVEFVTLGVLLLIPVIYFVLVMGQLQAAAFAVESASREGARVVTAADDEKEGAARLATVVDLALADQGFEPPDDPPPTVSVTCEAEPCLTPEAAVTVVVEVDVVLPGVPAFVDGLIPTRVPVRADAVAVVDRYADTAP